ncbi:dihydroorotate dehydrogenase [Amycolatopsis coloradensis]|nr:dihydroorotate dehydrogenase [Amycolatopsis coloradensis]
MPIFPILGLRTKNPVIIGSGLLTDQEGNIRKLLAKGAGAVVTKTIHPSPPEGLAERILRLPVGMLNSTTYSKRPIGYWLTMLRSCAEEGLPVIANLHADTPVELGRLAQEVEAAGCPALELGISCINEESDAEDDPDRVRAYTAAVRSRVTIPFSVKLAAGEGLTDRALAAADAGANAITLSDTIPGAAVSPKTGALELNGVFGYSGPGIKPLVLAAIWRLRRRGFDLPIMGSGGVTCGRDVVDYLRAGADVVQVYTALHTDMYNTLDTILTGTEHLLAESTKVAH